MISYLQVDNLSKRFGEQLLFENISFGIGKGQKVALIAKNGMGKSTLLRIIAGKDTSESGTVIFRNDITVGILDQDPALDPENSVFEEVFHSDSPVLKLIKAYEEAVAHNHTEALEKLIPEMDIHSAWDYDTTIKQILSELKIDTYDKKIGQLSGGQKKRVGLAKVLISNPDFLILDEPTNHLDIEMTEWLEEYLGKSNATLLMVTHDRYFLDRVCNQIIEIDEFGLFSYSGNYAYYLADILDHAPHIIKEDLAITFHIMLDQSEAGAATTMIKDQMLEAYGVDLQQLYQDALHNSPVIAPAQIENMGEVLGRMMLEDMKAAGAPAEVIQEMEKDMQETSRDNPMTVITNDRSTDGAAAIFYPGVMDQVGERLNGDYFILPSSVHEILVVPDDGNISFRELKDMVKEVNRTQVAPEDLLTDQVYHYDTADRIFEKAGTFAERKKQKEAEKGISADKAADRLPRSEKRHKTAEMSL